MRHRSITAVLLAVVGVLLIPTAAMAHIDPDPTEAQAGSRLSVGFTVEHGCDGSPTTSLDMRLPDGATYAIPEPPEGWDGSVVDNVVTFEGGLLPDDKELTFNVALTLPPTPDTTVYFPFVQRCEVGEIRWIDVPADGSGEQLDEPAPAMALFGPVATTTTPETTTTVAPPTTLAPQTTATPMTTTPSPTTTATATTAPVVTEQPVDTAGAGSSPALVEPDVDEDDDSGIGLLVLLGVGLAAVVAGAAFYLGRRPS